MSSAEGVIKAVKFGDINLNDPFFDSLKKAYREFSDWFERKHEEKAFIVYDDEDYVQAFLYLKVEHGPVVDIEPPLMTSKCLKVGTLKINARGTKLGERFVKKIVDTAIFNDVRHCYVTVFQQHEVLIKILTRYGFKQYGVKHTKNGTENVYLKDMTRISGDLLTDYPIIDARKSQKWLLAIYPKYHSILFPDSILKTEDASIVDDVSFSNSIHKAYLGHAVEIPKMKIGDCIVIYRCGSPQNNEIAWYRSVATSLCVVEEIRKKSSFTSKEDLVAYCQKYSVFSSDDICDLYDMKKRTELHTIKMMYNIAFPKRPILKDLVEHAGLPDPKRTYYGLVRLTDDQFKKILALGQIYEGLVIN